jgi:hypothetical protein
MAAAKPVVAEVTPQIAASGNLVAATNPFLLVGGESALLVEGSIEPSLTISGSDGSELALDGVLTGRQYSRIYGNFVLGSVHATGLLRESERLSLTALASYDRDIAADTITDGIGGAAGPRSIRNMVRARTGATWRPNERDTFTPVINFERVTFEDNPALLPVTSVSADLGYARRLSPRTSVGARLVARRSEIDGADTIDTLAAFATGDQRLSAVWRLSGDLGFERVELRGTPPPGVQRVRINPSAQIRLCAESERSGGCLNFGMASEASPLGGVQRRYTAMASANHRLSEAIRIAANVEYSQADSGQQTLAPGLGGAVARLQLDWTASRRTVVSGHVEYRRRDFDARRTVDGVFAGIGIRWGTR